MKQVYLTQGKVALVDDEDYPLVADRRWQAQYNAKAAKWYAACLVKRAKVYMHRLITNCPAGLVVDHENGDGLCNRRHNLRVTTTAFNNANCCAFGEIPYRGVTKQGRLFRARINGRHLGMFATAEEAARAYDDAAAQEWGAFAWRNFRDQPLTFVEDIPF